jgi:hypothetical protein
MHEAQTEKVLHHRRAIFGNDIKQWAAQKRVFENGQKLRICCLLPSNPKVEGVSR